MRFYMLVLFVLSSMVYAGAPRVVPAILDSIPHEKSHFTQGIFFDGKEIVETTGQYGESGLYPVRLMARFLIRRASRTAISVKVPLP